jgi:dTDP-4-amino-4,6-dideoxygalactose transaminase
VTRIFLSPPDVGPAEKSALARAFETNYITSAGPELDAFEAEVAEYCHRRHAVGLSSCTAALHLSLLVLGVKPGDRVVTSTMTFTATVNSIIHAGAVPVLVDCDQTGNMDPGLVEVALDSLADKGQRVAAVMPVDLLGKLADYDRINAIAGDRSIPVVSDAAEGMGATLGGRPAGSFGTSAAVSFNGNKIMTTSGGGMYLTDDEALAQHVRKL